MPLVFAIVALLLFAVPPVQELELTVRLTTDKSDYAVGEPIQLELVVEVEGSSAVTLEFTTSQRYDFDIYDAEGELAWRWSSEMGFAQVLGSETLEPEGRLQYQTQYTGALDAGSYRVTGYITARNYELKDELDLVIR